MLPLSFHLNPPNHYLLNEFLQIFHTIFHQLPTIGSHVVVIKLVVHLDLYSCPIKEIFKYLRFCSKVKLKAILWIEYLQMYIFCKLLNQMKYRLTCYTCTGIGVQERICVQYFLDVRSYVLTK